MAAAAAASMAVGGTLIATAPPPARSLPSRPGATAHHSRPGHRPARPVRSAVPSPAGRGDLAAGKPVSASSFVPAHAPPAAVDGTAVSYWESGATFPQWLQVDLGSPMRVGSIVLSLPPSRSWPVCTQTLSVSGSADGTTYITLAKSAGYLFSPATGNTVTVTLHTVTVRYIKVTFTANTALPVAQLAELSVHPR